MSKSKARKQREHLLRNGGYIVSRGNWNGINPVTKTTPTLRQKIDRMVKKHKTNNSDC